MNKKNQPTYNKESSEVLKSTINFPKSSLLNSLDSTPIDQLEGYGVPMAKKLETEYIDRLANNELKLKRYLADVKEQISEGKDLKNNTIGNALTKIRAIAQKNIKTSDIHEMPNREIQFAIGEIEKIAA